MNEALPIPTSAPSSVRATPPAPASATASGSQPSIEFRALLERLREQAQSLERSTEKALGASELPGAVKEARESLDGALSLAEGLLEAYRANQMSSPVPTNAASS